ncbi:Aspartyl protease [Sphingomonas rubra]|uniref:Aspartyl protease n=2 Tax=Sphingomonas rubra TaxID=634430 RepID=A0A1I5TV52_9SPHN|nr:Aspartyl protease [Sphingomonas rubra]
MERIAALIGLALAAAHPAAAQDALPAPAPETEVPADVLAIGAEDLRMTVPVDVGGRGVWPFVIDTGAERTVLSRELAERLALAPGRPVRVTTMTGLVVTPTAVVPALRVSTLAPPAIEAPLFGRVNLGAIGMIGLDALQGHAVVIDFDANTMSLRPSRRRKLVAREGEIVVTAKRRSGQLVVTDARWGGRRVSVVIDTGSPVTIANPALLAAARRAPARLGTLSVIAPDGSVLAADARALDGVEIGSVTLNGVAVAVADAAPFHRFDLADTPALLLGMETLRLFRRVEIDFPGRSIRFTLPRAVARPRGAF